VDRHGYVEIFPQSQNGAASTVRTKLFRGVFSDLNISSRLGNSARYVYFPEGQKFETRNNDDIDRAIASFSQKKASSFIHKLESRWHYVAMATVVMVLFGAWVSFYGVPVAAKTIAYVLPDKISAKADEQTLSLLEGDFLQPSTLDESVKQRVRQHFDKIIKDHPNDNLTLLFRASDVGANAFALPHGTIIFTDDMVKLAKNDDELLSVMAHEVGHVVHRHGMRGVIQTSILSFMVMLMTGDATAASEIFLGIPVLLTQLGYSRAFEREADSYAMQYMQDNNIDLGHFSSLMSRLQHSHTTCDTIPVGNQKDKESSVCEPDDDWQKYLSTHPPLQERIERFDEHAVGNEHAH